ncbi:MAG: PAS domain S-box protein [Bacteroidales bacterium]|nr:PAS domain S-box protein [Bacteroidales bacterium]MBN2757042.1 PAS domain S-box protein [Bacteroidales bacterium]
MKNLMKFLMLEDNFSDAKLIEIELKKSKINFKLKYVENRDEFIDGINKFKPDFILSDYTLPQFTGIEALGIALDLCPEIPFVIVTGTLNEEIAVECIKLGAWDYVLKGNLIRLIPAIENSIKLKKQKDGNAISQQKLIESEARLKDLYDNAPDMFLSINPETKEIIECNKRVLSKLGYKRDEFVGKNLYDFYSEESVDFTEKVLYPRFFKTGFLKNEDLQVIRKDGSVLDVLLSSTAVYDKKGKIKYSRSIWRDVTENKFLQQELLKSNTIINRSPFVVVSWKNDEKRSIDFITSNVRNLLGYTDEEFLSDKIQYSKIIHPEDAEMVENEVITASNNKKKVSFSHKPYRLICKNKNVIWIDDKTHILRNHKGEITHYQGIISDITNQVIAEQLLLTQKNEYLSLYEEYRVQNENLKLSNEQIIAAETKYRSILDNNSDAIIISSTDYKLRYRNPAASKNIKQNGDSEYCYIALFGFKEKCPWCVFDTLKKNEVIEKEIIHPTTNKYYITTFSYLKNTDDTYSLMSVYKDITELRKTEEEKIKLLASLEASFNEIYLFEINNFRFEYINDASVKNLGYTRDEILKMTVLDINTELNEIEFKKIINPLFSGKKGKITFQTRHKRKDNTFYPLEIQLQLIKQNDKKYFLAVGNDISEKLKEEAEIRKLTTAIEQSPVAIVITDYNGDIEFVNPKFIDITGYTLNEVLGQNPRILKSGFHPKEFYVNLWDTISSGETWNGALKNKKKNGEFYWEDVTIGPVTDDKGIITNYIALKEDITKRKEIEDNLIIKSQQIENIFNNTKDIFYSIDVDTNKVLQISPACIDIFGYKPQDFYSNSNLITEIIHPEDKYFAKINRADFKKGMPIINNYRIIKPDGEIRWITNKMSPQFDDKNNLHGVSAFISDTTENTILQNALQESFNLNQKIIKTAELGVGIYNKNGDCISANDNIIKIVGGTTSEVLMQNFRKLPSWEKSGLLKDAEKCLETKKEVKRILRLASSFGKEIWCETHFSIHEADNETKLLLLVRDISDLKLAEKEIIYKAEEISNLIQTVNNAIFVIDKNGKINIWNKSAEKITGYKKEEILNKNFAGELFEGENKKNIASIIENALKGYEIENYEFEIKQQNGKFKKILLNTSAHLDIKGNIKGVICAGQDITELDKYRSKLEKKVKIRTKKLESLLKKEKELSELKSRFVSMASHEFRTPLSAISFSAGFLKKYWPKIEEKSRNEKLNKIETQVHHMTDLLDDVLVIGKVSANKLAFMPEELDFNEFIEPIIEEVLNVTNNTHEIKIETLEANTKIYIDKKLGRNIFINFLSNAIKFSPNRKFINFNCLKTKEFMIFEVIDYGIGINRNEIKEIFTPFHRGQNVETIQGTGLGLAIVKEAVEKHNGKIYIDSNEGKGTKFTFTLPHKPEIV